MPASHITDPLRKIWNVLQAEGDKRPELFDCRLCLDTGMAWPEGSERVACTCEMGRSVKESGIA